MHEAPFARRTIRSAHATGTGASAHHRDVERRWRRTAAVVRPHVDERLALSGAGIIYPDSRAVCDRRGAGNRRGRNQDAASRRELCAPADRVLRTRDRRVCPTAAAQNLAGLADARPVPDRATERACVELRRAYRAVRDLLCGDRPVAQLLAADTASGQAEGCIRRSPERYEQGSQRNGVVADEGEGLEHWTGVSLLGAGGAPAWAEGSVFSKCGTAGT